MMQPNEAVHLQSLVARRRSRLINELQTEGLRFEGQAPDGPARKGGAGPSDHCAIEVMGSTVMVPVFTDAASRSRYSARIAANPDCADLLCDGKQIGLIRLPRPPRFYAGQTDDGVPYWKIAQLHARDVLASTVLQTCVRYTDVATRCQFCAIGESLAAGRTIARKTPEQLAEVAEAAERLDGVRHMVLTTGTPGGSDRGARLLCDVVRAIRSRTTLPVQVQCEPPGDFAWFERLRESGVDSLGLHLEAWDPAVRARVMPGKAEVSIQTYLAAFEASVEVFGRGQVSSYLLAGLGDTKDGLLEAASTLIELGVYPFIVPFVPITGTPLADHPSPSSGFLESVLKPVSQLLRDAGMSSGDIRAGCGKCGACSPLATYES